MKKTLLVLAATAIALSSPANAQGDLRQDQQAIRPFMPLAPAPGRVVEINGMKCLIANLYDRSAQCADFGKVPIPVCFLPAIVEGKLVCGDRMVARN